MAVASKGRVLDGQMALDLFGARGAPDERPTYATPCPIREWCGAYHCDTGGCDGVRGWCRNALHAFEPGKCMLERKRYRGKSFCAAWDRYTNCREVGHCVYAERGGAE